MVGTLSVCAALVMSIVGGSARYDLDSNLEILVTIDGRRTTGK